MYTKYTMYTKMLINTYLLSYKQLYLLSYNLNSLNEEKQKQRQ